MLPRSTPFMELLWVVGLACHLSIIFVHGHTFFPADDFSGKNFFEQSRKMQAFKQSFSHNNYNDAIFLSSNPPSPSPQSSPSPPLPQLVPSSRVFPVTNYGADPTGKTDSIDAIDKAVSAAVQVAGNGELIDGVVNLGGAEIFLEGGNYLISRPLKVPAGHGNLMIHGGTLKASDNFPKDQYLLDFSDTSSSGTYKYEFITLTHLLLDSNFKGGGIQFVNSLRITIDNCYITHFTTNGIVAQGGHETYIRNTFLGQHITAGGDPSERTFTGTGINLMGNDNAVTDVVIFSAEIGILVSGQANVITGVHCYNKATGFGGTGIYLKLPGLTQTRIVNCYLDYTGIVAEDPVQLDIVDSFFLGDGYVVLKPINGVVNGVNIVDNMFSGSNNGIDIVKLDQSNGGFKQIEQVVIDRNNVRGMNIKSTTARKDMVGNTTSWTLDFNPTLVFPDLIKFVQYTFMSTNDGSFPKHVLRNVSNNKVFIESDVAVQGKVFVVVDQSSS